MQDLPENAILYANDSRGIFIPQFFAESIHRPFTSGIAPWDFEVLERGPDHDLYWEVWDAVLLHATVTDEQGQSYELFQDGDLWLVPTATEGETNLQEC